MTEAVKLPSGEDAWVTNALTLHLSSGAQVTAEGVPVEVLARSFGEYIRLGLKIIGAVYVTAVLVALAAAAAAVVVVTAYTSKPKVE
jgi:hypothetical protein